MLPKKQNFKNKNGFLKFHHLHFNPFCSAKKAEEQRKLEDELRFLRTEVEKYKSGKGSEFVRHWIN